MEDQDITKSLTEYNDIFKEEREEVGEMKAGQES